MHSKPGEITGIWGCYGAYQHVYFWINIALFFGVVAAQFVCLS